MRATPENRHRDEHAPSWVPWRLSLHASRALSARPGPAPRRATRRGEAERAAGCDFHRFQIGHDSQHCSQQALARLRLSALRVASANFFNFRGALLLSVHVAPAGRSIAARRTERAHRTWGRRPARTTTWSRYAPPRVSSASPRGFRCLFAHRHPRDLTSPPTRRHEQAHKPTSVTHSVVGNFTHDDELNLIVAYVPAASRTHPPPTLPRRLHRLVRKAQRSVRSSAFSGTFFARGRSRRRVRALV